MSTVVVGEIPAHDFALGKTFDRVPTVSFECERVVDHADNVTMPLLWARGVNGSDVHNALRSDETVSSVVALADFGDQQLFRISWAPQVRNVIGLITDSDGSVLDVRGEQGRWQFRVLYPNRQAITIMNGESRDISFVLNRVGQFEQKSSVRYGLTDKQHEALRVGWNEGYFDVPRRIGIEELSDTLGVTHQAVSERLRRGQDTLIQEALGLYRKEEQPIIV